jgi:hypothetical protein
MTVLSIQSDIINDIQVVGDITAGVYLKSDGSLGGSLVYDTTHAINPGVLLKTIGTGNYVYYGQTATATPTSWAGRAAFSLTGNIRSKDDINVYDGAISKYLVLPYTPTAGNACLVLTSLLSSGNYYVYNMVDMGKAYSTTVTLPAVSYNFTTSGATNAYETAILTVTNGRPDTETGITLRVTVPTFTSDVTMNVPLPNNTAYTVEELRDFLFTELTGHASLPDVWILTKAGTDTITFTASIYGAMATNNYAVTQIFSGAPSVAAATSPGLFSVRQLLVSP